MRSFSFLPASSIRLRFLLHTPTDKHCNCTSSNSNHFIRAHRILRQAVGRITSLAIASAPPANQTTAHPKAAHIRLCTVPRHTLFPAPSFFPTFSQLFLPLSELQVLIDFLYPAPDWLFSALHLQSRRQLAVPPSRRLWICLSSCPSTYNHHHFSSISLVRDGSYFTSSYTICRLPNELRVPPSRPDY